MDAIEGVVGFDRVTFKNDRIQKTRIRGEISEGMICAEDELGLGADHEGIMILDPGAIPGTPCAGYFRMEEDTVFQIGLTPNRSDAAKRRAPQE